MNATYLVTIEVENEMVIPQVSMDIEDELSEAGFDVIKVVPWARPTLDITSATAFPEPPPPLF